MARTAQNPPLPKAPREERAHLLRPPRSVLLRGAVVITAVAAAALLAVTLAPDGNEPAGDPLIAGHGSIQATEAWGQDQGSLGRAHSSQDSAVAGSVEPTGGDSGYVNPWAAGNAAVAHYFAELGKQCMTAGP